MCAFIGRVKSRGLRVAKREPTESKYVVEKCIGKAICFLQVWEFTIKLGDIDFTSNFRASFIVRVIAISDRYRELDFKIAYDDRDEISSRNGQFDALYVFKLFKCPF